MLDQDSPWRLLFALIAFCCIGNSTDAANWNVSAINSLQIDSTGANVTFGELSGVTYWGPAPTVGKHRFLAVQDNGSGVVALDLAFNLSGQILTAEFVSNLPLDTPRDYEGIARVGDNFYVSDENGPGVREFDPATGDQMQSIGIPSVFTTHRRSNLGFESLTYDAANATLWTANEGALTVDGGIATSVSGSTVRLLELNQSGNTFTAGSQFAYEVEPINGAENSSARSGLSDLVALPDGTLLALERSLAAVIPPFWSRMYEIDFSGATDVSVAPFDAGLDGQTYTEVGKELVWEGRAGGGFGQNLEGLSVGPRLPDGSWVLVGVVDDADVLSGNTVLSYLATPVTPIPLDSDLADFDADGIVGGADFLTWQRGVGVGTLAAPQHGDGNHDGQVDGDDFAIWQSQFGTALSTLQAIPEPGSLALLIIVTAGSLAVGRRREISR